MLNSNDFRIIRNNTIVDLYNKYKLRYTEIATLQVQDLDDNKIMLRIQRGNRIFRVALTKEISKNMQLLSRGKEFDEYIFSSNKGNHTHLSRTMITKIIDTWRYEDLELINFIKDDSYTMQFNGCDYKILKGNKPIDGISLKNRVDAVKIIDILNMNLQA